MFCSKCITVIYSPILTTILDFHILILHYVSGRNTLSCKSDPIWNGFIIRKSCANTSGCIRRVHLMARLLVNHQRYMRRWDKWNHYCCYIASILSRVVQKNWIPEGVSSFPPTGKDDLQRTICFEDYPWDSFEVDWSITIRVFCSPRSRMDRWFPLLRRIEDFFVYIHFS